MFRRLFWFSLGAFAGYTVTVRVQRVVERAERYRPSRVRDEVVDTVLTVGREVRDLVRDLAGEPRPPVKERYGAISEVRPDGATRRGA